VHRRLPGSAHRCSSLAQAFQYLGAAFFILAKGDDYIFDRDAATKVKKGFEGREGAFDEDEYRTCIGDHWPIRNDRRDRRFMPAQVVFNCGQLGGLQPGDRVLDPYANPGVKEACSILGWQHIDGGLPSQFRGKKPTALQKETTDEA
jgi:hypothetical protein